MPTEGGESVTTTGSSGNQTPPWCQAYTSPDWLHYYAREGSSVGYAAWMITAMTAYGTAAALLGCFLVALCSNAFVQYHPATNPVVLRQLGKYRLGLMLTATTAFGLAVMRVVHVVTIYAMTVHYGLKSFACIELFSTYSPLNSYSQIEHTTGDYQTGLYRGLFCQQQYTSLLLMVYIVSSSRYANSTWKWVFTFNRILGFVAAVGLFLTTLELVGVIMPQLLTMAVYSRITLGVVSVLTLLAIYLNESARYRNLDMQQRDMYDRCRAAADGAPRTDPVSSDNSHPSPRNSEAGNTGNSADEDEMGTPTPDRRTSARFTVYCAAAETACLLLVLLIFAFTSLPGALTSNPATAFALYSILSRIFEIMFFVFVIIAITLRSLQLRRLYRATHLQEYLGEFDMVPGTGHGKPSGAAAGAGGGRCVSNDSFDSNPSPLHRLNSVADRHIAAPHQFAHTQQEQLQVLRRRVSGSSPIEYSPLPSDPRVLSEGDSNLPSSNVASSPGMWGLLSTLTGDSSSSVDNLHRGSTHTLPGGHRINGRSPGDIEVGGVDAHSSTTTNSIRTFSTQRSDQAVAPHYHEQGTRSHNRSDTNLNHTAGNSRHPVDTKLGASRDRVSARRIQGGSSSSSSGGPIRGNSTVSSHAATPASQRGSQSCSESYISV